MISCSLVLSERNRSHHAAKSSSYDVLLENSCAGFNCVVVQSLLLILGASESALRQS
jgi:hypothetical protein